MKNKEIRASYNDNTIIVYQAYDASIAVPAIQYQKFVSPFKFSRMSWIKPSFLWMMYRSGWGRKINQEQILSIELSRAGFEWALSNSCLSQYNENYYLSKVEWEKLTKKSPVKIQWDPEKNIYLNNLDYRSLQIGLAGIALEKYVNNWITSIKDITSKCNQIHNLVLSNDINEATKLLPREEVYPLLAKFKHKIHASL